MLQTLDCGCSGGTPAALEGCGCKYGGAGLRGFADLSAGSVDSTWHTAAILGSAVGALLVWWFNPDLRRDFDAEDRQRRSSLRRSVLQHKRSRR